MDAVTDLWVYDFATDSAEQWLPDQVGRAIWSPAGSAESILAIAQHNGEAFDLVLMDAPGQATTLVTAIDPLLFLVARWPGDRFCARQPIVCHPD